MNIVLAHGILGFRERFGLEYFRDVAEHLRGQGLRVYAAEVSPTDGVAVRGGQLRDQIDGQFAKGTFDASRKTHIIAHSMGGLDSRWMLSPANPDRIKRPIRSLTTVSTPHRGSAVADIATTPERFAELLHLPLGGGIPLLEFALDRLGISLTGLRNLTTGACKQFNAKFSNAPDVAYFSVAGTGREGMLKTAGFLLVFWQYLAAHSDEPNDGLVTLSSATWGDPQVVHWPADHADEIGTNLDTIGPASLPWLAKYDEIVARVREL